MCIHIIPCIATVYNKNMHVQLTYIASAYAMCVLFNLQLMCTIATAAKRPGSIITATLIIIVHVQ